MVVDHNQIGITVLPGRSKVFRTKYWSRRERRSADGNSDRARTVWFSDQIDTENIAARWAVERREAWMLIRGIVD